MGRVLRTMSVFLCIYAYNISYMCYYEARKNIAAGKKIQEIVAKRKTNDDVRIVKKRSYFRRKVEDEDEAKDKAEIEDEAEIMVTTKNKHSGHDSSQKKKDTHDSEKEIFERIAMTNAWGNPESISGAGSTVSVNRFRVQCIKKFIKEYGIKQIYDIPCGDANWQHTLLSENLQYYGSDISEHALAKAKEKNKMYSSNMHFLKPINLIHKIPNIIGKDVDKDNALFLSKEVVQHLSLKDGVSMLNNIRLSGARYIAVTNHDRRLFNVKENRDIKSGSFYPNNVFLPPFNFQNPIVDCSDMLQTGHDKKKYGNLLIFDLHGQDSEKILNLKNI